jgi:hypothetical protein
VERVLADVWMSEASTTHRWVAPVSLPWLNRASTTSKRGDAYRDGRGSDGGGVG